jgi:hypothetical protein
LINVLQNGRLKRPTIPTVHFSAAVAHWVYDDPDEGLWISASNQWSVDENNRELTSDALVASLLCQASHQSKRPNLKKWLRCDGGDWNLGHTNPVKGPARDIAPWDQAKLLSTVIDSGAYEQKVVAGTTRKLVLVWLYWTPEPPPGVQSSTPTPRKPAKKGLKKERGIRSRRRSRPSTNLRQNILALSLARCLLRSALIRSHGDKLRC